MGWSRPTRHGAVHTLQGKEKKRCMSILLLHVLFVLLCFLSPLRVSATPRELLSPQALCASASLRLCVRPIRVPLASLCPCLSSFQKLFSVVFQVVASCFSHAPSKPPKRRRSPRYLLAKCQGWGCWTGTTFQTPWARPPSRTRRPEMESCLMWSAIARREMPMRFAICSVVMPPFSETS